MTQKKQKIETSEAYAQLAGGPLEGPVEPSVTSPLLQPSTSRQSYDSVR